MIPCFLLVSAIAGSAAAASPRAAIDTLLAQQVLREAAALVERDGGRLWGRSLAGPLLLADPATREVLSSVPDAEGRLAPYGSLYRGTLPAAEGVANTARRWAGRSWTMLVWPLPEDSLERGAVLAHELWHRIQDSLGFPATSPRNQHLAGVSGRLWLRLEGRALRRALGLTGDQQVRALQDAIAFRRERRRLLPGADSAERALEMNEGLAAYTGSALAAPELELRRELVTRRLTELDRNERFERNFAYQTGPAYGYFLDLLAPEWRAGLTADDDLAFRLGGALGLRPGAGSAATRALPYGAAALRKEEAARASRLRAHMSDLERRFRTGPTLQLPLSQSQFTFDPNQVEAFEPLGSIYGSLMLTDRWGVLQCDASGGLISADFTRAIVPAPADTSGRRLTGPGWLLELAPNWRVAPGPRRGDWVLELVAPPLKEPR